MPAAPLLVFLSVLAGEPPMDTAVVPVIVPASAVEARDVDRAVAVAASRRRSLRLVPVEDLGGPSPGQRLRECGGDEACIGAVMAETSVPLALMVVVNARVTPAVVAVRALSTSQGGRRVGEVIAMLDHGDVDLVAAIGQASAQLFDALQHPVWARVVVHAEPSTAALRVGQPAAAQIESGLIAWTPPGDAVLWVEAPGYAPRSLGLTLRAGEEREVSVELDSEGALWRSPWLWAAVGVGVAAGVTAAALALPAAERCICVGHPASSCSCP